MVGLLLLRVLLYNMELASVTQIFIFVSERRKRRRTQGWNFQTLFSSCLTCYQTVLAVAFHVSCWDLPQPVWHPRRFHMSELLYCGTPTRQLHELLGERFQGV